jgi:mannosylfructose-phosphate synthase
MIPPGYDDHRFFPVSAASREAIRTRLGLRARSSSPSAASPATRATTSCSMPSRWSPPATPTRACTSPSAAPSSPPRSSNSSPSSSAQAAALGLAERVKFSGFVADADLADHYRAADVFVLSSRYEPFGMTAIEAMACGTPTVITTHGGLFRAVTFGRHALYADPLDKDDLGISIVKVLKHPRLAHRLARMGAHKARSLFTWTGIAQQLISLIEERATALAFTDNEWDEPWNDGD